MHQYRVSTGNESREKPPLGAEKEAKPPLSRVGPGVLIPLIDYYGFYHEVQSLSFLLENCLHGTRQTCDGETERFLHCETGGEFHANL
jgi:hypothetical protein